MIAKTVAEQVAISDVLSPLSLFHNNRGQNHRTHSRDTQLQLKQMISLPQYKCLSVLQSSATLTVSYLKISVGVLRCPKLLAHIPLSPVERPDRYLDPGCRQSSVCLMPMFLLVSQSQEPSSSPRPPEQDGLSHA